MTPPDRDLTRLAEAISKAVLDSLQRAVGDGHFQEALLKALRESPPADAGGEAAPVGSPSHPWQIPAAGSDADPLQAQKPAPAAVRKESEPIPANANKGTDALVKRDESRASPVLPPKPDDESSIFGTGGGQPKPKTDHYTAQILRNPHDFGELPPPPFSVRRAWTMVFVAWVVLMFLILAYHYWV